MLLASAHFGGPGIGSGLAAEIARLAPSCGVSTLHLQTERLDGGLYRRLGWRPLEPLRHHGLEVLVMEKYVGAATAHSNGGTES